MTLWSRGLARSHDKLKPLYLYYYSPYGHQTWLDSDLPEDLSTIKSINTDHVVFAKSHDKPKPLYLHYQSAYGHQTW